MSMINKDIHVYDDIIDLPHHVSSRHPQMTMQARAAQFQPFAALSGYGDAVNETERVVEQKIELGEDAKASIDRQLAQLAMDETGCLQACFTYFVPDGIKAGGAYEMAVGVVRKLDELNRCIILTDGRFVPVDDLLAIEILEDNGL